MNTPFFHALDKCPSYKWLTLTFACSPITKCGLKRLQFSGPSSMLVMMGSAWLCAFDVSWRPWIRRTWEALSWDGPTLQVSICTCCFLEPSTLLGENCRICVGWISSLLTAQLRCAHLRHAHLRPLPVPFGYRSWLSSVHGISRGSEHVFHGPEGSFILPPPHCDQGMTAWPDFPLGDLLSAVRGQLWGVPVRRPLWLASAHDQL